MNFSRLSKACNSLCRPTLSKALYKLRRITISTPKSQNLLRVLLAQFFDFIFHLAIGPYQMELIHEPLQLFYYARICLYV